MNNSENLCLKSGRRETSKGVQINQGSVFPMKNNWFLTSFGSEIIHVFCSRCGFIKESFVKNPDKFKDNED